MLDSVTLIVFIESCTTPVYSTPPSILFVDLNLAPGETVKCKCDIYWITAMLETYIIIV